MVAEKVLRCGGWRATDGEGQGVSGRGGRRRRDGWPLAGGDGGNATATAGSDRVKRDGRAAGRAR